MRDGTDRPEGERGSRAVSTLPGLDRTFTALKLALLVVGPEDEAVVLPGAGERGVPVHFTPGRRAWEGLPEPARARLRAALKGARESRGTVHARFDLPGRAGPVELEATISPLEDGHLAVLLADVTARRADEDALRQRDEERRRLLAASPTILYRVALGPDGSVKPLEVSENVTRLLGYAPEEPLAAGWWTENVHPDDLPTALNGIGVLVAAGRGTLEYRFRHRNGTWRLIRDEMWLERREDGRPAVIFGAWSDITPQRRAEERLREREARLRAILASTPDCIKLIGPDGWLEDMNPAGLAMLEASSLDEVRSKPLIEFIEPGGREDLQTLHARVMRGGAGSVRLRIQGLRGTRRVMEVQGTPLRDATGRVTAMLAVSRDITEAQRAEEALRVSRARLEVAVATAGLAVWERDMASTRAVWDERMYELFHRDPALGPPDLAEFEQLVHPEDLPRIRESLERGLRTGERVSLEYRTRPGAGPIRHLVVAFRRVERQREEAACLVGTVRDRTREIELEEQFRQAQKLESIGRLAGGVAHDFNNLLTAILGHAELLEGDLAGEAERLRHVRSIRKSGERARDLTRQLLAFARRQVVAPRLVDLNVHLRDSQSMLRRLVGEDVELVVETTEGLRPVLADPGQIEQILLNLAVNARDAMPKGGRLTFRTGNVEITAEEAARHADFTAGPHVLLSVSDSGTGMDAEVLAHIFEPFFTTKPAGVGTGLGLATVYGVVRQSGGHIRVASERGEGTTFEIFLPQADPAHVPATVPDPVVRVPAGRPSETLLVVEDDPSVRDLVEACLSEAGYTVLAAASPREALDVAGCHEGPLDLLVTDVVMPGMNGMDLAEMLSARRAGLKVLFMSGYPGDTLARHGVEDEGRAFLPKPFSLSGLLGRVREVLHGIIPPSS